MIDARVRFARRRALARLGPWPDLAGHSPLSPEVLYRAAVEVRELQIGSDDDLLAADVLRAQLEADYRLASERGALSGTALEIRAEIERVIAGFGRPRPEPLPGGWAWPAGEQAEVD